MTSRGPANPSPDRPGAAAPAARITDEQVDAFFDRELDPQRSRELLSGLKHDATHSEEIARTQRVLSLLRRTPIHAERAEEERIDAIMARVSGRRSFLPESWRRFVTAGRLAAAATFLLAGFGVAVFGRVHPDALRLAPGSAPLATLVNSGRDEAVAGAAGCASTLECISDRVQFRAQVLTCQSVVGPVQPSSDPLRPGMIAAVRFTTGDSDVLLPSGSGEPYAGPMGATFALGLELSSARQRSGASAPVFVPALRPEGSLRSIDVRAVSSQMGKASAFFTPAAGSGDCQTVTVGDHTVVVPATLDPQGWAGGPLAAHRLLLIQASPSDLFPER